jgi:hypothetical protein
MGQQMLKRLSCNRDCKIPVVPATSKLEAALDAASIHHCARFSLRKYERPLFEALREW